MNVPRPTVTLTVELTAVDDRDGHVEGTVSTAGGDAVGFSGWLALLELLERSAVELKART